MTLNGVMAVFAFSAHYLKVVEDIPKLSATKV